MAEKDEMGNRNAFSKTVNLFKSNFKILAKFQNPIKLYKFY